MKKHSIKFKKIILTTFIATSLYAIPSSIAATQGTLDPTSTGTFDVTVTIPDRVRITGMQDIAFGTFTHAGDFNDDYPTCVYTNTLSAQYGVTASGDGTGSAFTLTNGTDTVPYRVFWNNAEGTTVGEGEILTTVKRDNVTNSNQVSSDCTTGGNTSNLHVSIAEANMIGVTNGTYSGTLTITIDPS